MSAKTTIEKGWKGVVASEDSKGEIVLMLPEGETIYQDGKKWAFHMNAIDLIIYFREICTPTGNLIAA